MDNTLYVGLSHQLALRRSLDVIANNLANMNTTGFKKESVAYRDFGVMMGDTTNPVARRVDYVQDYGVIRDLTEGGFVNTSNPFDITVSGNGYLTVRMPDGSEKYTRNGNLRRSPDGKLVDASNRPVLGEGNQPIQFNDQDVDVKIAQDGTVSSNSGRLGKIRVVSFADERDLKKIGDSLYETTATAQPSANFKIVQGGLEGSNVRPVLEMTDMIEITRRYQTVAQLIEQTEDSQKNAIQRLGKVA